MSQMDVNVPEAAERAGYIDTLNSYSRSNALHISALSLLLRQMTTAKNLQDFMVSSSGLFSIFTTPVWIDPNGNSKSIVADLKIAFELYYFIKKRIIYFCIFHSPFIIFRQFEFDVKNISHIRQQREFVITIVNVYRTRLLIFITSVFSV